MFLKLRQKIGLARLFVPPHSEYLNVFSHPRSGTHFLEAFVGQNFYENENLELKNFPWGHWKNRVINTEGYKYGKLFGSHVFPNNSFKKINYPVVYIYRDGRAVSYSLYNTDNFIIPGKESVTFEEFLRLKIDWEGSPAYKAKAKLTIAEHWYQHVIGWIKLASENNNILVLRYEELISSPENSYNLIRMRFFEKQEKKDRNQIHLVDKPVGLLPNKAKIDTWKSHFSKNDNDFFLSHIPFSDRKMLLYEG